jgi:hypothetical protein
LDGFADEIIVTNVLLALRARVGSSKNLLFLWCRHYLFNKTDTTNRTKFFVDVPRGITNFISGGVVDNDFFHTFTVSSSSTEAKFPLRISFSKSS